MQNANETWNQIKESILHEVTVEHGTLNSPVKQQHHIIEMEDNGVNRVEVTHNGPQNVTIEDIGEDRAADKDDNPGDDRDDDPPDARAGDNNDDLEFEDVRDRDDDPDGSVHEEDPIIGLLLRIIQKMLVTLSNKIPGTDETLTRQ